MDWLTSTMMAAGRVNRRFWRYFDALSMIGFMTGGCLCCLLKAACFL